MRLNKILTEQQLENAKYDVVIEEAVQAYWGGYNRLYGLPLSESAFQLSEQEIQQKMAMTILTLPMDQLDRLEEGIADALKKGTEAFKKGAMAVAGIPGKVIKGAFGLLPIPQAWKDKGKEFITKMIDLAKKAKDAVVAWVKKQGEKLHSSATKVCGAAPQSLNASLELFDKIITEAEETAKVTLETYLASEEFKKVIADNKTGNDLPNQIALAVVATKKALGDTVTGLNVRAVATPVIGTTLGDGFDIKGDAFVDYFKKETIADKIKDYASKAGLKNPEEEANLEVCELTFGEEVIQKAYADPRVKKFIDKAGGKGLDANKSIFRKALGSSKGSIAMAAVAITMKTFMSTSPLLPILITAIVAPIATEIALFIMKEKLGEDHPATKGMDLLNDIFQGISKLASLLTIGDALTGGAVSDATGLADATPEVGLAGAEDAAKDSAVDGVFDARGLTDLSKESQEILNNWTQADGNLELSPKTMDAFFADKAAHMTDQQWIDFNEIIMNAPKSDEGYKALVAVLDQKSDSPIVIDMDTTTNTDPSIKQSADTAGEVASSLVDEVKLDATLEKLGFDETKFPQAKQNLMLSMSDAANDGGAEATKAGAKFTQEAFTKLAEENPKEALKLMAAMDDGGKIPQSSWDALTNGEAPTADEGVAPKVTNPIDDEVAKLSTELLDTKLTEFGLSSSTLNSEAFTGDMKKELLTLIGAGATEGGADTLTSDELVKFVADHKGVLSADDVKGLATKFSLNDQLNIGIGGDVSKVEVSGGEDVQSNDGMEASTETLNAAKAEVTAAQTARDQLDWEDEDIEIEEADKALALAKAKVGLIEAKMALAAGTGSQELVDAAQSKFDLAEAGGSDTNGEVTDDELETANDDQGSEENAEVSPSQYNEYYVSPEGKTLKTFITAMDGVEPADVLKELADANVPPAEALKLLTSIGDNYSALDTGASIDEVMKFASTHSSYEGDITKMMEFAGEGKLARLLTPALEVDLAKDQIVAIFDQAPTEKFIENLVGPTGTPDDMTNVMKILKNGNPVSIKNIIALSQVQEGLLTTLKAAPVFGADGGEKIMHVFSNPKINAENIQQLMSSNAITNTQVIIDKLPYFDTQSSLVTSLAKIDADSMTPILAGVNDGSIPKEKLIKLLMAPVDKVNALTDAASITALITEIDEAKAMADQVAGMALSPTSPAGINLDGYVGSDELATSLEQLEATKTSLAAHFGDIEKVKQIDINKLVDHLKEIAKTHPDVGANPFDGAAGKFEDAQAIFLKELAEGNNPNVPTSLMTDEAVRSAVEAAAPVSQAANTALNAVIPTGDIEMVTAEQMKVVQETISTKANEALTANQNAVKLLQQSVDNAGNSAPEAMKTALVDAKAALTIADTANQTAQNTIIAIDGISMVDAEGVALDDESIATNIQSAINASSDDKVKANLQAMYDNYHDASSDGG